jgi:hypothetical protein
VATSTNETGGREDDSANAAREALDAHSDGTPAAAQALATVLVRNIDHDLHGLPTFVHAHNTHKKLDPEQAAFDELRLTAINRRLSAACAGNNAPARPCGGGRGRDRGRRRGRDPRCGYGLVVDRVNVRVRL